MNAPVVTRNELIEKEVEFKPLGEASTIKLSIALVRQWLTTPTKKNKLPSDSDVMKFIQLCKARELNPWVGDAYCVGYDGEDGPTFNLITSVQALFKRAEAHPEFDGLESGVLVKDKKTKDIIECVGDFFDDEDATLVGGWARVHRKDCSKPFTERVRFKTFNKNRSVWKTDPEGMISKCAEAGALRKAFPNQLGGLYLSEEIERNTIEGSAVVVGQMEGVAAELAQKRAAAAITHAPEAPSFADSLDASFEPERETVERQASTHSEPRREQAREVAEQPQNAVVLGAFDRYRAEIPKCQSEQVAQVLCMTIKRDAQLTVDERKRLLRDANEKVHELAAQGL